MALDLVEKGCTHFADGDVLLAMFTLSFESGQAGIVRNLPNGIGAGSTECFVAVRSDALLPGISAHFMTLPASQRRR